MSGYAICGSFCTHKVSLEILASLCQQYDVQPIMSHITATTDTRFGSCADLRIQTEALCGRPVIDTVQDAEPLGPSRPLDALVICPCTGNTLAKLAQGITDTPVCMAAKAHLRSNRPLVVALASNDAMSANLKNIAALLNRKHIYFVPMRQDDPVHKPHSLVADFTLTEQALTAALEGRQLRPLFL